MVPHDEIAVTLDVARAFDSLGVAYFVGGSMASSIHGRARSTQDVDLVADLQAVHVGPLVLALGADYYADESAIAAAVRQQASFNLVHHPTTTKIDVFIAGRDDFSVEKMSRRQRLEVIDAPGGELCVSSAEDIVLQKLRWYVEGGYVSDQQLRDVIGVLQVQGDALDAAYLTNWARRLGIDDLLADAIARARVT